MNVSVVVCTYSLTRYGDVTEAIESVLAQTYDEIEIVVVVDGNEDVVDRLREDYGERDPITVHCNGENSGVSYSRTRGAGLASGDIVAFIDDDAVADPEWIQRLVWTYEETNALAAGGRMVGEWLVDRPWYLPSEFNWLVGVTHPGFAKPDDEIRNTFESNISFRRDVFLELGGFDPELGPDANSYSHSEGAEIGTRLRAKYGRGVVYNPDAVVAHKVFEHRTRLRWLLSRAFEQGMSKRKLERRATTPAGEERGYLRQLCTEHVPRRIRALVSNPLLAAVGQLLLLFVFTGAVGFGYVYATLVRN